MVLCRLQGCDVGCSFCDTKETWSVDDLNRRDDLTAALGVNELFAEVTPRELADSIASIAGNLEWVLITGGEPAIYDLRELLDSLHRIGYKTAVETSGTRPLQGRPNWVCVSPKVDMPGGQSLVADVVSLADELKFAVGKKSDVETAISILQSMETKPGVQICVQPLSLSRKATALCLETALELGWRLSLQTHKLIGID
jgi:7-carboxy-7-deazaguanine synthase